jgi:hypothetical protein
VIDALEFPLALARGQHFGRAAGEVPGTFVYERDAPPTKRVA